MREDGHVRSIAILLATGINAVGQREILGIQLGDSESTQTWTSFFAWLKQRGLQGVDLVVSDHHGGLVAAVAAQFQGASWQRCQVHFMRNILDAAPKALQEDLHGRVRAVFDAPDVPTARTLLQVVLTDFAPKAPKAMQTLEAGFDDAIAILAFPFPLRKRLRTTNAVERLNEEIRRRERVIRIFPNRAAIVRLVGALLMEQDEVWSTGRHYLPMEVYWNWKADTAQQPTPLPLSL